VEALELGWQQIIIAAIQIGYSYYLKHRSKLNNKWIPALNLGVAAAYFTVATFIQNPEGGVLAAITAVIVKAAETVIISTGVHSAIKNVTTNGKEVK